MYIYFFFHILSLVLREQFVQAASCLVNLLENGFSVLIIIFQDGSGLITFLLCFFPDLGSTTGVWAWMAATIPRSKTSSRQKEFANT